MSNVISEKQIPSTVTVLVDEQLREQIATLARANERSVGAEVRVAMREHLARGSENEEGT